MSEGFANPIIGGGGSLVYPSIHSPDFVQGVSGWSIDKDGNAYFYGVTLTGGSLIISGSGDGVFIYSGTPAYGNLIGAWVSAGVTEDAYGNPVVTGINVNQGLLIGVLLQYPTIANAIISNALLTAPQITQAAITGGTMTQTTITFNSTGGLLLCYGTTTTTVTFSTPGAGQWTCPAGITSAKIVNVGGSSSGDGGSTTAGGPGGGGGEQAGEPNYPLTPGDVYSYVVGMGGAAATTGSPGNSGTQTSFDGSNIVANPGIAGALGSPGIGGSGSTNTIESPGINGTANSGTHGGAGGASGSGSAGGAGGASGNPGVAGTAPGGAGGGAGEGGTSSGNVTFDPIETISYYGSGTERNVDGDLYQNYSSGNPGGDGDQYAFWYYDASQIASALSGKGITSVYFYPINLHSWYDSGMYMVLGYSTSIHGTHQGEQVNWIAEGSEGTIGMGTWFGQFFTDAFDGATSVAIALGPGGAVGETGNLYYYGYFDTYSGALTVYYTEGSSESSGAGTNGQIQITYTESSQPIIGVSPIAGTDAESNSYGPGLNLWEQSSTPAAVTAGLLYGNANATPSIVLPSGFAGSVPISQTDYNSAGYDSNTANTINAVSKAWSIPAGDQKVGTKYTIKLSGTNGWNPIAQGPILNMFGLSTHLVWYPGGSNNLPAGVGVNGDGYSWQAEVYVTITAISATVGVAVVGGFFILWNASTGATATSVALTAAGATTLTGLNTEAATTMAFAWDMAGAITQSGVKSYESEFIRSGA